MTLKEQIKYIKGLKKEIIQTAHDGGTYKIYVSEEDAKTLQLIIESLDRLKGLEK